MGVDRCYCVNVEFARLIEMHKHDGRTFAQISAETRCGTQCGLCVPYARAAIATGQASLPVRTPVELEEMTKTANAAPQTPARPSSTKNEASEKAAGGS